MTFTAVPPDRVAYLDFVARSIEPPDYDTTILVVRWDGTAGVFERADGVEEFTDPALAYPWLEAWENGVAIPAETLAGVAETVRELARRVADLEASAKPRKAGK